MFGPSRSNSIEDMLDFHSTVDRFFTQFWNALPARTAAVGTDVQIRTTDDAWKLTVPMPGVDPRYVTLDLSGSTLTIRAEQPVGEDDPSLHFEHTITIPKMVDVEKIRATHRHGVLELILPWNETVKPRRIQIETTTEQDKQLHAMAS
jgi:HSP20 family protein